MTPEAALAFLRGRERFQVKVGTRNIRRVAAELGHPERRYPSVIIAGTNGKGSTAALLDAILRAQGLSVGRFTSPHLVEIEERVTVDGRRLDRDEFAGMVGEVAAASDRLPPDCRPSFFESVTATAMIAFAAHRVDAAVFEVGMGGRWDATTATDAPLGLVTRIALDHQRYLGPTVEAIAAEKAGVARPDGELLAGRQTPGAERVLKIEARTRGARFRSVPEETEANFEILPMGSRGRLRTPEALYDDLWLPLPGRHQVDNLALAVRGAERLFARLGRPAPNPEWVRRGIREARWPGRLEWLPAGASRPAILLDAAHNPSGAAELGAYLAAMPRRGGRVLVFGASGDKRVVGMLPELVPHCDRVVLTAAASRRALPLDRLAERAAAFPWEEGAGPDAVEGVGRALERAFDAVGPDGEVVVAGSIFLLGDALRYLRGMPARRSSAAPMESPALPAETLAAP